MSPLPRRLLRFLRWLVAGVFAGALAGTLVLVGAYLYLGPKLPSIESLKDVRLQVPLRVYTRDGRLLAEFGEKRRSPVHYAQVPKFMVDAFLAAEDDRFFSHPGVDYRGMLRAAFNLAITGEKGQGGSTITMQVARNFFLSPEKTFARKLNEVFLALKIERELTKQEILELYLNKIYFGNRAYGVQAAAHIYYGVDIDQLTLAQIAMIAGLPKAPSRYNPIVNPSRSLERRAYVLGRMQHLGFITPTQYEQAMAAPVTASRHALRIAVSAPYVAEMVRSEMVKRFGPEAYTAGYQVVTTIDGDRQIAADHALRQALQDYDLRHGYRGPERHVDPTRVADAAERDQLLSDVPMVGGLRPALVTAVGERDAKVYVAGGDEIDLPWEGMAWARKYIDDNHRGPKPDKAVDVLAVGDLVRVAQNADGSWRLAQVPKVSGALVALDPDNGGIEALVGGFDYFESKFNRVTQAQRQPGSSFKPFIYSAALEKGFTAATLVNDAPVVFDDPSLESVWRPQNYSGRFFGPTRLREALVHSRNLVSIRVLRAIGVGYAIDYVTRFGFDKDALPRNLSLALGSASVTPLQLATGYAVFANGGYRVEPYFIQTIKDEHDRVIEQANPPRVCADCPADGAAAPQPGAAAAADVAGVAPVADGSSPEATGATPEVTAPPAPVPAPRVITPQNDYLMTTMMRDVILHGTGRRALSLGRHDLAGKTGTTNDQRDAWFAGFNQGLVAVAWVGFDQVRSLGGRETGAHAALPMWKAFMASALKGVPEQPLNQPPGLMTVRIDPRTGLLASSNATDAVFETFRVGHVPKRTADTSQGTSGDGGSDGGATPYSGEIF